MAAVAILNVMPLSILVTCLIFRSDELQSSKIWLIYVNQRLSYYCLCENPRWRPSQGHLAFYFCSILWHHCMQDIKLSPPAKFRANACKSKSKRVM